MIYVLCIHPFIRWNWDIVIYFDMAHYFQMEPEADEVVIADHGKKWNLVLIYWHPDVNIRNFMIICLKFAFEILSI